MMLRGLFAVAFLGCSGESEIPVGPSDGFAEIYARAMPFDVFSSIGSQKMLFTKTPFPGCERGLLVTISEAIGLSGPSRDDSMPPEIGPIEDLTTTTVPPEVTNASSPPGVLQKDGGECKGDKRCERRSSWLKNILKAVEGWSYDPKTFTEALGQGDDELRLRNVKSEDINAGLTRVESAIRAGIALRGGRNYPGKHISENLEVMITAFLVGKLAVLNQAVMRSGNAKLIEDFENLSLRGFVTSAPGALERVMGFDGKGRFSLTDDEIQSLLEVPGDTPSYGVDLMKLARGAGILSALDDVMIAFGGSRVVGEVLRGFLTENTSGSFSGGLLDVFAGRMEHNSPLKSMGEALCNSVIHGNARDPDPAWSVCSIMTAVTALLTCSPSEAPICPKSAAASGDVLDSGEDERRLPLQSPYHYVERPLSSGAPRNRGATFLNLSCGVAGESAPEVMEYSIIPDKEIFGDVESKWVLTESERAQRLLSTVDDPNERAATFAAWEGISASSYFTGTVNACGIMPGDPLFNGDRLIPGWNTTAMEFMAQETSATGEKWATGQVSLIALLEKSKLQQGTCEFMVLTRGTATDFEWFVNFQANLTPVPGVDWGSIPSEFKNSKVIPAGEGEILAHRGYVAFSHASSEYVTSRIMQDIESGKCNAATTRLHFVGHSLGGGLNAVLALRVAHRLKLAYPNFSQITTMSFGSSHSLNARAVQYLEALADTRSYTFEWDMVPFMPCSTGPVRNCQGPRYMGPIGVGVEKEAFGAHPNEIVMRGNDMINIDPELTYFYKDNKFLKLQATGSVALSAKLTGHLNPPTPMQFNAGHICSYGCYASYRYCKAKYDSFDLKNSFQCLPSNMCSEEQGCFPAPEPSEVDSYGHSYPLASLTSATPEDSVVACDLIPGMMIDAKFSLFG